MAGNIKWNQAVQRVQRGGETYQGTDWGTQTAGMRGCMGASWLGAHHLGGCHQRYIRPAIHCGTSGAARTHGL